MVKILVVDDEPVYCRNLKLLLERKGHHVETAHDGEAALQIAQSFIPELLIVDWMLRNELNGRDLACSLHTLIPELNSILITGFPAEELEEQINNSPITAVMRKPFSLDDLMLRIAEIVDIHP